MSEETEQLSTKPKRKHPPLTLVVIGGVIVVLVGIILLLALKLQNASKVAVPPTVAAKARSSIYVPQRLPAGYRIIESSFTYTEDVMVFRAENEIGDSISFSQQKKPASFNFQTFYKENIIDPTTLKKVPYPAVTGKTMVGDRSMLSVVAGDTWVIATTQSQLTEDDFTLIARSFAKQ